MSMKLYDWRPKRKRDDDVPAEARKRKQRGLKRQPKIRRATDEPTRMEAAQTALQGGLSRVRQSNPLAELKRVRRERTIYRPAAQASRGAAELMRSPRWLSFGLLVACIYAIYLIGTNPRFILYNFDVEGVEVLHPDEIIRAAGLEGRHIFSVEPEAAADAIGEVPGVVSAEVNLNWPDNLQIIVEEDTPVLIWLENGREYWVNSDGTLIPAFGQSLDLPRVFANVPPVAPKPIDPDVIEAEGETIVPPPATTLEFIPDNLIAQALLLQNEFPYVEQIMWTPTDGLQFQDERGWQAKFGIGGDTDMKLAVYDQIAELITSQGIVAEYVNVAWPERAVFKPISGYQVAEESEQ